MLNGGKLKYFKVLREIQIWLRSWYAQDVNNFSKIPYFVFPILTTARIDLESSQRNPHITKYR